MAVINSTVCTKEASNCDTTTTLSIFRSLVTTGFSKKKDHKYLLNDEHSVNRTDVTNKFRRAKRSEHKLSHDEFDYVSKPSVFSETIEAPNKINKPLYINKKDNSDYNNIIYDYNFETKDNADIGKYTIDEPEYIVEGKFLSTLAQNQPTYKSESHFIINNQQKLATKDAIEEFELIFNKIDQQEEASTSNSIKNKYMNQPQQNRVSQSKLNDLQHANNNQNYDLLEFSNETELIGKAPYHIDNVYISTPINKPQRLKNVDHSLDDLIETLTNRDTNKPQGTNTPENVYIKESLVKQKYKREKQEKYVLDEYGPINTYMIETNRNSSFGDNLFTHKLITSSSITKQQAKYSRPIIREKERNLYNNLKTTTNAYKG